MTPKDNDTIIELLKEQNKKLDKIISYLVETEDKTIEVKFIVNADELIARLDKIRS